MISATALLITGTEHRAHANSTTTIINIASGLCVEVAPPINDPFNFFLTGLSVLQSTCNGSDEQIWDIKLVNIREVNHQNRLTYHIVNRRSGMCMDLTEGNNAPGTPIQQWTCGASTTMEWLVPTSGTDPRLYNVRSLLVTPFTQRDRCLDIRAGSLQVGAVVQNALCTSDLSNLSQQFEYTPP
ncbi:MAG TPA: RICIN domain-containing protein [Kofleriaceae bacterium]